MCFYSMYVTGTKLYVELALISFNIWSSHVLLGKTSMSSIAIKYLSIIYFRLSTLFSAIYRPNRDGLLHVIVETGEPAKTSA